MKAAWTIRLEVGSWSKTIVRGEAVSPTDPVVVGDGLKFEWSYVDDRAPGHLEPAVLSFVLHGFKSTVLPDVQLGDPVRFIFTTGLTASRHIVFFRGRVTDVDLETSIPGRKRRRADMTITAADDLATLGDIPAGPYDPKTYGAGAWVDGSPKTGVPFYEVTRTVRAAFAMPATWTSYDGNMFVSEFIGNDSTLEWSRRVGAGMIYDGRPYTALTSSMFSGGRDVVVALPDIPTSPYYWQDIYNPTWRVTAPGGGEGEVTATGTLPVGLDRTARPLVWMVPHRVRLRGDEPTALNLALSGGNVTVAPQVAATPGYAARVVLSGDQIVAPGRARRDRSSVYNAVEYLPSPETSPDDPTDYPASGIGPNPGAYFLPVSATAADATTYGRITRTVETEAARDWWTNYYGQPPTPHQLAEAYMPEVDAIRAEWALDEYLVLPDQADTLEQWTAAARLAMPANVAGEVGREVAVVDLEDAPRGAQLIVGVQTRASLEMIGGAPQITVGAQPGPLKAAATYASHLVTAADLVGTPYDLPANRWAGVTGTLARYIAKP